MDQQDTQTTTQVIPSGAIDMHGVYRVLVHALLLGLGVAVAKIEQSVLVAITNHSFGQYEMFAVAANTIIFTFLEKLFTKYNAPITPQQ